MTQDQQENVVDIFEYSKTEEQRFGFVRGSMQACRNHIALVTEIQEEVTKQVSQELNDKHEKHLAKLRQRQKCYKLIIIIQSILILWILL